MRLRANDALGAVDCFALARGQASGVEAGPIISVTEKLLSGAGGWQAMKAGRELLNAGRVLTANYEPPLLAGQVREGQKTYRAGLRIRTPTDVENICTCRESREWGKVCAHSLAVGLAWLVPQRVAVPVASQESEPRIARFVSPGENAGREVRLHFIFPPRFRDAWAKGRIMVCVEAELDGRRVMLDALPRGAQFACDGLDLAAINSLGEEITSVNTLSDAAFLRWLPALRGHPRISFGKSTPAHVLAEVYRPKILVRKEADDLVVSVDFGENETFLLAGTEAWLLRAENFLEVGHDLPSRLTSVWPQPLRLSGEGADQFLALELPIWREIAAIELPVALDVPTIEEAEPVFSLRLEGSMQQLRAMLRCRYGERPPVSRWFRREPFCFS